jgi:hypothetical protein
LPRKWQKNFQTDKPKTDTPIPPEYKRQVKVFLEKEAERFPPSHAWDHCIPLKDNAPDTINEKVFNLPKPGKLTIKG